MTFYETDYYSEAEIAALLNNEEYYRQLFNRSNVSLYELYPEEYDPTDLPLDIETRVIPIIFMFIFTVGIVGNGLVVYVVLRNGAMKTVTNIYLTNIAIMDLLLLGFGVPFNAVLYWKYYWPFGNTICKIVNYMNMVTLTANVLTLTAVGIDRYLAIVHPVRSRLTRTVRKTMLVILVIWILSLCLSVPFAVISKTEPQFILGADHEMCVVRWESPIYRKTYIAMQFSFLYAIPQTVLGYGYYKMAKRLWNSVYPPSHANIISIVALRSRRRVAKMLFVVTLAFAICWLPYHVIQLYSFSDSQHVNTEFTYYFKIFAHIMAYLVHAINPIIYCFMNKSFRVTVKSAFLCKKANLKPIVALRRNDVQPILPPENEGRNQMNETPARLFLIPHRELGRVRSDSV